MNERQVPNSAGGHAFRVDDMTRLQRFLILGSEGGSYYADERKLTLDNVKAVKRCITASEESGINAVTEIARISKSRRAAKPGPGLFALAMAASYGSDKVRKTAFDFLNDVALTGSHLQMFIDYIGPMRGWGRGLRKAIGNWYTQRPLKDAVYQTVKYRQRYNWTHRDLLRKAHPYVTDSQMNILFEWITKGTLPSWQDHPALHLILAYEDAKTAGPNDLARIIELRKLTWIMVPSEMLDKPEVWRALTQDMPMTALHRNLATLTRVGVIAPMDSASVCESLKKIGTMNVIHPIAVFTTAELSLHPYHEAKAGGVAAPNNPRHSAHRPGTEEGRDEPQTAEKTTAGQRARPVHQVPPRTCQAKQGPLRAVLQKDPRIRSQEKSRSQTGQVYRGVSLSHAHRAKKARRKPCLLFAASQTGRRATMDYGPWASRREK